MTVAVALKVVPGSDKVLREAGREAAFRGTRLVMIEVVDSLDLDLADAHRRGLLDEATRMLAAAGVEGVPVEVHLTTADEDLGDAVLGAATSLDAELLVIGARRRSPVGKLLLGSATQSIILDATIPVLVVKTT